MEKFIAKLTKAELGVIRMVLPDNPDASCDALEADIADEALYALDGLQGKMEADGYDFVVVDLAKYFDRAQVNIIVDGLKKTMKEFPDTVTLNALGNDPEYAESIKKFQEFLPVPMVLQTFLEFQQGKRSSYEQSLQTL